jgi:hypothetical protein
VTNEGSAPNATAYGSQEIAVDFSPRLYAQAQATKSRCTNPAAIPLARETGMVTTSMTPAPMARVRRLTSPRTTGLSWRFTMVSRAASIASLLQPIERWPVKIVAATRRHPAGLRPADQATAVTSAVTAIVGPGWQARARPLTVLHTGRLTEVTMPR